MKKSKAMPRRELLAEVTRLRMNGERLKALRLVREWTAAHRAKSATGLR